MFSLAAWKFYTKRDLFHLCYQNFSCRARFSDIDRVQHLSYQSSARICHFLSQLEKEIGFLFFSIKSPRNYQIIIQTLADLKQLRGVLHETRQDDLIIASSFTLLKYNNYQSQLDELIRKPGMLPRLSSSRLLGSPRALMGGLRRRQTAPGAASNWAENVAFSHTAFRCPETVNELQDVVAAADKLRVLGSGHSFSSLCRTDDTMVSLAFMRNVLGVEVGETDMSIQVEGG